MAIDSSIVAPSALYDGDGRPLGRGGLLFSQEQAVAVTRREGPMLLSANAGSGKTAVLAERFARSVIEDGLAPHELLAITFTDKAAGELRTRIRARFTELGHGDAARDTADAWISTIHGFCARVLRAHAVSAGLDPAFTVLDESGARNARFEAFDRALEAFLAPADGDGSAALELAAAWGIDRLRDAILFAYEELRSTGQTVPRLPVATPRAVLPDALSALARAHAALTAESLGWRSLKTLDKAREMLSAAAEALAAGEDGAAQLATLKFTGNVPECRTDAGDAFRAAVANVAEAVVDAAALGDHALLGELLRLHGLAYNEAKRARSAVDYDDLELLVRDLFDRSPGVAAGYAERFARIMVDEFQDTNPLQMQLLRHLDRGNVFLVGDELQSIYGFRHADIAVFRAEHERHAAIGAAPELATNWRSRPALLAGINAAFGGVHPRFVDLQAGRDDEPLGGGAPRIELLLTDAAFDEDAAQDVRADLAAGMPSTKKVARLAEAHAIARRVSDLIEAGHRPSEIAVLMRSAPDMGVFERALEREGIATLASGGRGYWLRQQVQDLTSYLGALANPLDEPALFALLASPLVGLGSDALATIVHGARAARRSVFEFMCSGAFSLSSTDSGRLATFTSWFAAEREMAPCLDIDQLIARVVRRTGYDLHVLALNGGRRRLANVHKLQRLAAAFEAVNGRDVRGFIDHATAEVEVEAREPEAPVELGTLEAVRLMTVHAAKGLEFDVVVVADLGRQGNSGSPDLLVDAGEVGVRVIRPGAATANAFAFDEIRKRMVEAEDAEERRVFHVAFTRARERLILTGTVALAGEWPRSGPARPPLYWIGRCLDEGLLNRLSPDAPAASIEHLQRGWSLRCNVELTTPGSLAAAAALEPAPEPIQLQFGLDETPAQVIAPIAETAPPVPAIAAMSYSSLASYTECPYRYYLQRVLRLPDQDPPAGLLVEPESAAGTGLDPLLRGSIAHLLLEQFAPAAVGPEDVLTLAGQMGAELADEDVQDLVSLARAFGDSPLAARLQAAERVRPEYPFAFPLDGDPDAPLVNGIVDVMAQEADGSILIVDYKTNRVGDADLPGVVECSYAIQRSIYALAALLTGVARAEVAYCFLERPAEPVVSLHVQDDMPVLLEEIRGRAAGLRHGEFPVAADPHRDLCLTCPGRGGLCSWPQERVLQPLAPAEG